MSKTPIFKKTVTATELGANSGEALIAAERGPVAVKKHGKPRYVIMTLDRYEAMRRRGDTRRAYTAVTMPPDMMDAMVQSMKETADGDEE